MVGLVAEPADLEMRDDDLQAAEYGVRPPRGAKKLGAARRMTMMTPAPPEYGVRPPRGAKKLGAARRFFGSASMNVEVRGEPDG